MAPDTERPLQDDGWLTDPRPPRVGRLPAGDRQPSGRRGLRTAVMSAVGLGSLALLAVAVLLGTLRSPGGNPPGSNPGAKGSSPSGEGGSVIAGTITVAPELRGRLHEGGTLFIIARREAGGAGSPYAVKRVSRPRFPLPYELGPEDVMMTGMPFQGEVSVSARLTKAGSAGPPQPGDLEGEHRGRVSVGERGVDIVIARVR